MDKAAFVTAMTKKELQLEELKASREAEGKETYINPIVLAFLESADRIRKSSQGL